MPSRLSSLLVRDGLVGVKRMEKAFQRQVIYGGCLDTILLEMGVVPEARLVQYLSLATGLPPATREETNVFDPEAVKRCPLEVARMYRIVPLGLDNGALRVLVHDPVDLSQMEELANDLDFAIQPLVVPEYRFHVVFGRMFGGTPDARFSTLAKQAEDAAPTTPVGRAKTVIVEQTATSSSRSPEMSSDAIVVDVALPPSETPEQAKPRTQTMELSTDALAKHLEETEQQRRDAAPTKKLDRDVVQQAIDAVDSPAAAEEPVEPEEPSEPVEPEEPEEPEETIEAENEAAPDRPLESAETPLPGPVAEPAPPRAAPGAPDVTPLTAVAARDALAAADDRDLIFNILLRAIRSQAWFAGLLTVQGGAAIGRIAIVGDEVDREMITQVLIPVSEAPAFHTCTTTAAPFIGPIATGDPEIDGMIERLGGVVPPAALLLPIVIKERVVAIAIGHRGGEPIGVAEVAEILPLAGAAAEAVMRLIRKAKSVGYRSVQSDGTPQVNTDEVPTKKMERSTSEWSTPDDTSSPDIEFGQEVSLEADEPGPIADLFEAVESEDDDRSEAAIQEALERAGESLDHMRTIFPGKIRVDRYEVSGRVLRAAQHGPVLDLVIRLGAAAADLLSEKMGDPQRDTRFYATLCAAELRPRSVLPALVERLFDNDYGIRGVAIDALAGYPTRELDRSLVRARQGLHSEEPDRVKAAADAVAALADIKAVPDLLDAVARHDKGTEHALIALKSLTKQSFGNSHRKWRTWWGKNKRRNRIEWLIDGLNHKDENIRRSSAEDLRKLTGEYFGYHHDLSKKEREQARKRWQQWWNDAGRRRFLRSEPEERHRPTAVLPAHKD